MNIERAANTRIVSTLPTDLSRFFLLRHGQSEANVRRLIASRPAAAERGFGLTSIGREQVRASLKAARESGVLPATCMVVSSPLLRAFESAQIAAEMLDATVTIDARLAERGFGDLELTSDERYEDVWSQDRLDPTHEQWGVESAMSILSRVSSLVRELHESSAAGTFLLCTHGDVASVLLCAASGQGLSQHRDVGAMGNGEIRRLVGP